MGTDLIRIFRQLGFVLSVLLGIGSNSFKFLTFLFHDFLTDAPLRPFFYWRLKFNKGFIKKYPISALEILDLAMAMSVFSALNYDIF
ncbi:MAG: hypothetical protein LC107_02690 [Chitinophagales bacterium]|nr:hypothetical protein [Chitinophagales bacterium]